MNKTYLVCHVIPDVNIKSGGPSFSVVDSVDDIASSLNSKLSFALISQYTEQTEYYPPKNKKVDAYIHGGSFLGNKLGFHLFLVLRKFFNNRRPALVISHGIWLPVNLFTFILSRKYKVPLVIQPHGMLEEWSLRQNRAIKKISMFFYQKKALESAIAFIATSESEYLNIRKLGLLQPVALIPNGINMPLRDKFLDKCATQKKESRTFLFLSRVHPKKGVDILLSAWSKIDTFGWRLKIVGMDSSSYSDKCRELADDLKITANVDFYNFCGELDREEHYLSADFFILPSFSENFGVVIAEALSYGLPVITSTGTPWNDLIKNNCGWWVDPSIQPIKQAIQAAMELNDEKYILMKSRAYKLAEEYRVDVSTNRKSEFYSWLIEKKSKPSFVLSN
jgi:glycosyltransferase involved in cell wall biosynthesis